jgi:hypothetical protein
MSDPAEPTSEPSSPVGTAKQGVLRVGAMIDTDIFVFPGLATGGEGYSNRSKAVDNVNSVKRNVPNATVVDTEQQS